MKISNTSSNALDARGQGGRAFKSDGGVVSIFAGDATKLYRLLANSFVDDNISITDSVNNFFRVTCTKLSTN